MAPVRGKKLTEGLECRFRQWSKFAFTCKWFAKGERASGAYFCRGYARYSAKTHHWDIDPCRNERG